MLLEAGGRVKAPRHSKFKASLKYMKLGNKQILRRADRMFQIVNRKEYIETEVWFYVSLQDGV